LLVPAGPGTDCIVVLVPADTMLQRIVKLMLSMRVHTRMMTGRKTVIDTKRKKMPAPMKAAK
jgi:hypothetical protein